MNYTTKRVLGHFLKDYQRLLRRTQPQDIHPFLQDFLSKQEIESIIKWLMDGVALQHVDWKNSSKQELLEVVADDVSILEYFLEEWNNEILHREVLTPTSVWDTLVQLGMESHYLGSKVLAHWDEYDHANYRALQLKSGRITRLFGIYQTSVQQENVNQATTPPNRLFDSREQAEAEKHYLMLKENFKADELHILEVFKAI